VSLSAASVLSRGIPQRTSTAMPEFIHERAVLRARERQQHSGVERGQEPGPGQQPAPLFRQEERGQEHYESLPQLAFNAAGP
jgi:hypothetical protein